MSKKSASKNGEITKVGDIRLDKISIFFRKSVLRSVLKILTMEHSGFRTLKGVKNINRLFNNIDLSKYKNNPELESYIWCIKYISKQWLDGIVDIGIIADMAKRMPEYDNVKEGIITSSMNDDNIISPPEAKAIFDLVGEALQYGYILSLKDEYINLLDDIDITSPGAFKTLVNRLFEISKSLLDIQHNTSLVANKITFNSADMDSIKESIQQTITSLTSSHNMLKVGIRRWNTLLSPAYMNGRLYVYMGAPGSGKSIMILKSALDMRKYNPDYVPKTPGMKPCVLYITMENTFTESIERVWNMTFDDPITDYSPDEATEKLCKELGIARVTRDDIVATDENNNKLYTQLIEPGDETKNIEIVMKYFSYREINTDDLFTIIQDLRDENMEVCALCFDYIKRIRPASVSINDTTKTELSRIMNELKALAVIQDIPVITAHQTNRMAAASIDAASRQGKADIIKSVGRENTGDAWEVVEIADFLAVVGIDYKPGTDDKYMEMNVIKRRRIDSNEAEFAKYTYLAHPFAKNNGLRLLDDINLDRVLSLQSLSTDIDVVGKEKTNAVPRLKTFSQDDFEDDDFS